MLLVAPAGAMRCDVFLGALLKRQRIGLLEPFLRPIPCVNPTLNGFSVQSRTIRKR